MIRLAFFCVNYNTYNETHRFLSSISTALNNTCLCFEISVFICDNTENDIEQIDFKDNRIRISVFSDKVNRGYFGGIGYMMKQVDISIFDYVVISNVDVELSKNSLDVLSNKSYSKNVGWIAPQIYSSSENRDRNPKMIGRNSRRKIQLFRFCFRFPILHYLYTKTLYHRKKIEHHSAGTIYGGHGSFMILTKSYFYKCGIINYPVFLYGEEIYLAENCKNAGLTVEYDPSIRIEDKDHASTSKMKRKFYYRCNYDAMDFILKNYY